VDAGRTGSPFDDASDLADSKSPVAKPRTDRHGGNGAQARARARTLLAGGRAADANAVTRAARPSPRGRGLSPKASSLAAGIALRQSQGARRGAKALSRRSMTAWRPTSPKRQEKK